MDEFKEHSEWCGLPPTWVELIIKFSSVDSILDSVIFVHTVHNEVILSKFKVSIGTISAVPLVENDDLWCDEALCIQFHFDNLEVPLKELENNVGAVRSRNHGMTPNYLCKVYGINADTVKKINEITFYSFKHNNSGHYFVPNILPIIECLDTRKASPISSWKIFMLLKKQNLTKNTYTCNYLSPQIKEKIEIP